MEDKRPKCTSVDHVVLEVVCIGGTTTAPPSHIPSGLTRRGSNASEISIADSDITICSLESTDVDCNSFTSKGSSKCFSSSFRGFEKASQVSSPMNPTESFVNFKDVDARIVYVNNPEKNKGYCSNTIVTSKYNKYNFIPRFLGSRLREVANFYFLLVGAGQMIPQITSTFGLPYQWLVLAVVLTIDAIFAGIEDLARHKADEKMNALKTHVFDAKADGCFREIVWCDVVVGDILKLNNYEVCPADILLLAVSEANPDEPAGICFVETKSLDGETNLKVRQALNCTFSQLRDPKSLGRLPGRLIFEKPNHDVNKFSGRFEPQEGLMIPIDLKNVALRGSAIRNTRFVYGFVLNTGKDTKIMQSASETPSKNSKSSQIINKCIQILIVLMVLLCILAASVCTGWISRNQENSYYLGIKMQQGKGGRTSFRDDGLAWFIYLGYYWILISSFVPITLYVTIAIVKNYQKRFIDRDLGMYDEVSDTPALVRNADLNDELGQITHIFSDKTGTLTANEMNFRKMSINGISYGRGTTEIGREAMARLGKEVSLNDVLADNSQEEITMDNVRFVDPIHEFQKHRNPENCPEQAEHIKNFLLHLAICHSVVLEQCQTTKVPKFSASSPDELALVSGAAYFGYSFQARKNGSITIRIPNGNQMTFELLEMIDFSSARKRMSVIVRTPERKILLLCKGADSVIYARLQESPSVPEMVDKTTQHLERYASEGLRTLVIAQKEIPENEFLRWSKAYKLALSDLDQVTRQKLGEPNRIEDLEEQIEKDLELLGATAIEDRLQDEVTSTIADLAHAGIKIWILTGDKEETAINIGFACRLLNNDMETVVINPTTYPSMSELYDFLLYRVKEYRTLLKEGYTESLTAQAIVIDGRSLTMVFENDLLRDLFLEVSQLCRAVICCRVSPKQKAQVVRLYKTTVQGCRSLAIGDGANDVGMIQEAHIGIGISGQEGMQAVNSSDYAIAQFRFLKRLLVVHGRWNYRRMAKLALYVVYKNIIVYGTGFVLGVFTGGSGTRFFNNMWTTGYNVLWTSLPIMVVGILEQDVSAKTAETLPGIYHSGAQGELLSVPIFSQWIAESVYESIVCALVPALVIGRVDSHGHGYSLDMCGGISFCCVMMVGWFKLALNVVSWNCITIFSFLISVIGWYLCGCLISVYFPVVISDVVFPYVFELCEFYLILYLVLLLCLGRDFLFKAYKREMRPEYYHIAQEYEILKTNREKVLWTPPPLRFKRFQANLKEAKPLFDDTCGNPKLVIGPTKRLYTGFAYSTQTFEDRFLNPLREMVIPMRQMMGKITDRLGSFVVENNNKNESESDHGQTEEEIAAITTIPITTQSFEEKTKSLRPEKQVVYEVQRYQIFSGWGSTPNVHLLANDPPRFTNMELNDGSSTFDLTGWVLDEKFGTEIDHWQYANKFKDFLRAQATGASLPRKEKNRMKKKLNQLRGRAVRRRRWVRPERIAYRSRLRKSLRHETIQEIAEHEVNG